MTLPGFTAERSLARTTRRYRSAASGSVAQQGVTPELIAGGGGWPWWPQCGPGCFPTSETVFLLECSVSAPWRRSRDSGAGRSG